MLEYILYGASFCFSVLFYVVSLSCLIKCMYASLELRYILGNKNILKCSILSLFPLKVPRTNLRNPGLFIVPNIASMLP